MSKPARDRIRIPAAELSYRFSRSSGPGGQGVNTTDSRVEVLWTLAASSALTEAQKSLAASRLSSRMVDGVVSVVSSEYRSQHRNRESATARLEDLLTHAVTPTRSRRATRPTRASRERRLDGKRRRSEIKRDRRGGGGSD